MLDFGRGFARICETLGEDLQGFVRLWDRFARIQVRLCKDSQGSLGQGFARIRESLGEDLDLQDLWERIRKDY